VEPTNLEHLARQFPKHTSPIETIKPYPLPPWWSPPYETEIQGDKKSAKLKHNATHHDENTLTIYTDGSGIEGHVGAAAYSPKTSQTHQQYLESDEGHNIYSAEVTAFELAAGIALDSPLSYAKCVIYADSQSAIQGINNPNKQSGQRILISAIQKLETLISTRHMAIEIKWVPGHRGIEGNEKADKAAKEAANSGGTHINILRTIHKPLKAARFVNIKREITHDWNAAWQKHENAKQLRRITSKPNTARGTNLYKSVPRHQASQLARLRTGHCLLNQYLHRFGHEESPLCECGSGAIENVQHYLLYCPRFDRQRAELTKDVGVGGLWIEKLLGYPRMIGKTLKYVEETKRFPF